MTREYIHVPVGEEVESISGRYHIMKEDTMIMDGREVFYIVGAASFDSSCCGDGGCGYAVVPGILVKKHAGRTDEGMQFSLVEPVVDERLQREIARAIKDKEQVPQVNFL